MGDTYLSLTGQVHICKLGLIHRNFAPRSFFCSAVYDIKQYLLHIDNQKVSEVNFPDDNLQSGTQCIDGVEYSKADTICCLFTKIFRRRHGTVDLA